MAAVRSQKSSSSERQCLSSRSSPSMLYPFQPRGWALVGRMQRASYEGIGSVRRLRDLSPVLGQMIRFGIVGGLSTVLYAIIYWPLATYAIAPVLAVIVAFGVSVCVGYVLHSRWSFKGYGRAER